LKRAGENLDCSDSLENVTESKSYEINNPITALNSGEIKHAVQRSAKRETNEEEIAGGNFNTFGEHASVQV
jgi:hypothetical protein